MARPLFSMLPARRISSLSIALLSACLAASVGACDRKPSSEGIPYGEPVGVQMEASAEVPAFDIALAVNKGADIDPLIAPLGGLLHKAVRACPGFAKASAVGEVTQIAFSVDQGKAVGAVVSGAHPDPCLTQQINAQEVPTPAKLSVVAQIRFGDPSGNALKKPAP